MFSRDGGIDSEEKLRHPRTDAVMIIMTDRARERMLLIREFRLELGREICGLPAGLIDPGETVEEAVARELSEEIGWRPDQMRYMYSFPNIYRYSGFDVHTMDLFFLCKYKGDFGALAAHDDVESCFWLSRDEIHPDRFAFQSVRRAITLLLDDDACWQPD